MSWSYAWKPDPASIRLRRVHWSARSPSGWDRESASESSRSRFSKPSAAASFDGSSATSKAFIKWSRRRSALVRCSESQNPSRTRLKTIIRPSTPVVGSTRSGESPNTSAVIPVSAAREGVNEPRGFRTAGPASNVWDHVRDREYKPVWVAWERQRRNLTLSRNLAIRLVELDFTGPRLVRYVRAAVSTLLTLLRRRPTLIVVQSPSLVLGRLAVIYGRLSRIPVVIDAHNGALRPTPGPSAPLAVRVTRRAI